MELPATRSRQRFTRADRLLKRWQFVFLLENGKKLQNKYFIGFYKSNDHHRCRLGITVSKKVGNAVARNKIKRLVREYFRQNRTMFTRSWDIHLIAKKAIADHCAQDVWIALEKLLTRIESN